MSQGSAGRGTTPAETSPRAVVDEHPFLSKFTEMAETLEDGITIQDADGRVIYANDTAARACGFEVGTELVEASPEEIFRRFRLLDEDGQPIGREDLPGRIALGGEPSPEMLLCYHIKATDERRWAEIKATPIFDEDGAVAYAVNVIHDVTRLKRVEDELRQAKATLQDRVEERTRELQLVNDLIDQTNDAIFVVHPGTAGFVHVNQRAADELGYDRETLLELSVLDVDPALADGDAWDGFLDEIHQQGTLRMENELIRRDGSSFLGEINATFVREHDEDYIVAVVRDITDRKTTEERLALYAQELERSNEELQDFAHIISHDLQEPLRMVASYVELLARRYSDQLDDDADEFIGFAVDGVRRMETLIKGLLTYSRVQSRGQPFEPVDLDEILKGVLANLATAIDDHGATITHDPLPTVQADPAQMIQLLQNLIGNAIKFHGDQAPEVHIRATSNGGRWRLEVQDHGIGIAPDQTERIFKVFQRLHTEEEFAGTGMGLAICKRIAERHGGTIAVESEPGQGSTFIVDLPIEPARKDDILPDAVTTGEPDQVVGAADR